MKATLAMVKVAAVLGMCLCAPPGCTRQAPQQPTAQDGQLVAPQPTADEPPAAGGEPCGAVKCAANEVCCNPSCGICTAPGSVCTQQMCEPAVADPNAGSPCLDDADCHAVADYCKGCDCRALGPKQELPACSGPGVRCFADPCLTKVAVCRAGQCVVTPKP